MLQDQPHHQTDQRFSHFLRQIAPIGQAGRYSACEQIQLLCCKALPAPIADRWRRRLSCHGSDSDRERSHLHCEAEHSMMSSSTQGRAARTTHQAPPGQQTDRSRSERPLRTWRDRTSMPESPATARHQSRPKCSGRLRRQPFRSPREQRRRARTKDETDTERSGKRSCGRSETSLYNEVRPHLSLHKDAPVPREVRTAGRVLAVPILGGLHHQYVRV